MAGRGVSNNVIYLLSFDRGFCSLFLFLSVFLFFTLFFPLFVYLSLFSFLLSLPSRKIPILAKMATSSFGFTLNYSNPNEKKKMWPLSEWFQQNFKRGLWLAQYGSPNKSCDWQMECSDWSAWITYPFLWKERWCPVIDSPTREQRGISWKEML